MLLLGGIVLGGMMAGLGHAAWAQPTTTRPSEEGRHFVRNISRAEYGQGATPQNEAVVQDARGIMYFGNGEGVLEHDGTHWRIIPVKNYAQVLSLDVSEEGRVFVGAQEELGYLAPDSAGLLHYVSLLPRVPEAAHPFRDVSSTVATPEGVYFLTEGALLHWSAEADSMHYWPAEQAFYRAFNVRDTLYVHQRGVGLMYVADGALHLLPGSTPLADAYVKAVLPGAAGGLIVGTRERGLFRWSGGQLAAFAPELAPRLRRHGLSHGARLPDGRYAWGTLRGGIVLTGPAGTLLHMLDRSAGLRDDRIHHVYVDRRGDLWAAMNRGIAHVALSAPTTFFDELDGVQGKVVTAIARHRDRLHVATSQGIFLLEPGRSGRAATFTPVADLEQFCYALLSTEVGLLAGCTQGVYQIRQRQARLVRAGTSAYALHLDRGDPSYAYAGLHSGVARLHLQDERWRPDGTVPGMDNEVRTFAEAPVGTLWIGTDHTGVFRLDLDAAPALPGARQLSGVDDENVFVFEQDEAVLLSVREGLHRFDARLDSFRLNAAWHGVLPMQHPFVTRLAEDRSGDVWLFEWNAATAGVARRDEHGGYTWDPSPFARLPRAPIFAIYPEPDGTVWMGGTEGLFRYAGHAVQPDEQDVAALVRRVEAGPRDSLVFGGGTASPAKIVLPAHTMLRFTFAAPQFSDPSGIRYQVRLDNVDDAWSAWHAETRQTYTNLPAGNHTFRVRARDAAGAVSREATFAFTVLPPWYQTWWAYLLYAALGLALVGGLVGWRSAALRARSRRLEHLVEQRTAEVARQKRRLEAQNTQLERQNARIEEQARRLAELDAVKSRFFANLSHEFRTPLTLTIGPVEDILEGVHGPVGAEVEDRLWMVHRHANRLLRLVNQLLDLARLESGNMQLAPVRADLVAFLEPLVHAFMPLAERNRIALHFEPTEGRLDVPFDSDKLEKVVVNLLSNAFKATDSGGRIRVGVHVAPADAAGGEMVAIAVEDTGVGISAEELQVIFDRFRQGSTTSLASGTGIGLNLAKELVELHGGRLDVESTPGAGSTFTVYLPIQPHVAVPTEQDNVGDGAAGVEEAELLPPAVPTDEDAPAGDEDDRPRVLVVDDNADIRSYVRGHLEPRYAVAEAADGREGFQQARALLPDLIIADVMMPHADGHDLLRALKADPELDHVPLIFLTARATSEHKVEGLSTGADDYLTKPFDAQELLARVQNLIASRQWLREKFSRTVALTPSLVEVDASDDVFLEEVRAAVEAHLADEAFSVEMLAEAVALSPSQLQRRLKALLDCTPVQLIRRMRLERAAQLLEQQAGSVSEIAYAVGFNSHSYFSRCFREHFGQSPSQYATR